MTIIERSGGVPTGPKPTNRRRAPQPEERQIDAERTRTALLEAALDEFSAKGFAGARVRDIAARAGVSKDLIAYHFGGKEGLYQAVQAAWLGGGGVSDRNDLSLADSVMEFLSDALIDPRPMRLMAWRGLQKGEDPPDGKGEPHPLRANPLITRLAAGEIDPGLDPATLQLVLLGAIAAPVVFPDAAARLFGIEPTRREFEIQYREGLAGLLRALAGPPHPPADLPASRTPAARRDTAAAPMEA
jgi:AcrR family transcriptional regulator